MKTIDSGRLARALVLDVEPTGDGVFRVTGGRQPHVVRPTTAGQWTCDCIDSRFYRGECKHLLAVTLA